MSIHTTEPRPIDGPSLAPLPVEIVAISDHEWRVRDAARPADDATSLLGFIGRIGDVFEVVKIGSPRVRRYFGSFDGAVDDVVAAVRIAAVGA